MQPGFCLLLRLLAVQRCSNKVAMTAAQRLQMVVMHHPPLSLLAPPLLVRLMISWVAGLQGRALGLPGHHGAGLPLARSKLPPGLEGTPPLAC